ncbi:MAG: tyrosine-type recombinase/integrase [Lachnospiraceae bacterium]|nr:tyrosine-type recombinase/integrase [Lachnospiraceae bacterium]
MAGKDNNQKLNQCNILSAITANGIIDIDNVLETYMNNNKEQLLLKMHPYAITEPKSESGRWQTYYKDANGERKIIRTKTKDALLEKLIPIYFKESHLDKLIFSDLFLEWLEYKKTVTDSPNTIKRHKQHYKRYFEQSELHNMSVRRIDTLFLESECNRLVKEYSMSRKEWNNVKTILLGCFEYAVRKKYITVNPMNDVKILVKYRQVVKKTGKTETYNTEELEYLNKYLDTMYAETEDTVFLAVKINFLLGLRVGELVALKWEDCKEQSHIHIVREEVRNQETNRCEVVEHTKTNCDRYVPLVPKAISILEKIPKQGSYIFMRDGERITARQIAYVLEKYAERQGTATKSTHKMRKTYASMLNANGVPLDCIREMLGHSSLTTTLGYVYNPLTESETYNLITNAL